MTLSAGMLSDLDAIFADWDSAVYTHGGTPATIRGIFDAAYTELDIGVPVVNSKPAFLCKTSDVATAVRDDTLVVTSELYGVSAVTYYVTTVQHHTPDGGPGTTRLILRR